MYMAKLVVASAILILLAGCASVNNVNPSLSNSLSFTAFEKMQNISQNDVSIALYIEPSLKNLVAQQKIRNTNYSFDIGNAFSAKLVKALAYEFKTIHIIDTPMYKGDNPIDAVMRVNLQKAHVHAGVKPTFSLGCGLAGNCPNLANAYSRIAIRAEMVEPINNRVVWVGTTNAIAKASNTESRLAGTQEIGRSFAVSMNRVTDKAVGQLVGAMTRSTGLRTTMARWEQADAH